MGKDKISKTMGNIKGKESNFTLGIKYNKAREATEAREKESKVRRARIEK